MVAEIDKSNVFYSGAYLSGVQEKMKAAGAVDGEYKGLLYEDLKDDQKIVLEKEKLIRERLSEFLTKEKQLAFYDNRDYDTDEEIPDIRKCDKKGGCGLVLSDVGINNLSFEEILENVVKKNITKKQERKKIVQDKLNKIKAMSNHDLLVEIYLILKNGIGEEGMLAEAEMEAAKSCRYDDELSDIKKYLGGL